MWSLLSLHVAFNVCVHRAKENMVSPMLHLVQCIRRMEQSSGFKPLSFPLSLSYTQSLSSQSLPANSSARDGVQLSSPPSLHNYPLHTHSSKPTLGSYGGVPLANSSLLTQSHLSGSSSSISSIKSANSALSSAHSMHSHTHSRDGLVPDFASRHLRSHVPFSSTPRNPAPSTSGSQGDVSGGGRHRYGSSHSHASITTSSKPRPIPRREYLSSSSTDLYDKTLTESPEVELHRSRLKIKQLQKEVSKSQRI